MKKVFFKPWIGPDYATGGVFGKKILVLGEAHLCGNNCPECGHPELMDDCENFTTKNCVQILLDGQTDFWTGGFRKFERSLVGHETDVEESRKIWNSVSFYNFVQKSMDESRKSPEPNDFYESADAFFEVIDTLQPELIIGWGVTRLYKNMPGGDRWREGEILKVDDSEIKNGYYRRADGKETRVLWVYHPSSAYSWDRWHKVIKTML